jgi:DNA polymerase
MGADQNSEWHDAIASALDWWREAGVDVELQESPRDWLTAPAAASAAVAVAAEAAPVPAQLPATLAAYATWRSGPDVPEAGWRVPLIPATGPASSALMILVEMPEREDAAEGRLLGGGAGRLFDRMLAAIGLDRTQVHVASIAAARPVSGRIPREAVEPLSAIARHYVGLVQPKALLLLGNAPCQVMLGDLCQSARGTLRPVNQAGATMAVASFHPQQLLERPQMKAESWKDLQMLHGVLTS